MINCNFKKIRGQGTVEYMILCAVLVVGATALKGAVVEPLRSFFGRYSVAMRKPGSTGGRSQLKDFYQKNKDSPSPDAAVIVK